MFQDQESRPKVGAMRPAERRQQSPAGRKKTKFEELLGHEGPQVSRFPPLRALANSFERLILSMLCMRTLQSLMSAFVMNACQHTPSLHVSAWLMHHRGLAASFCGAL